MANFPADYSDSLDLIRAKGKHLHISLIQLFHTLDERLQ